MLYEHYESAGSSKVDWRLSGFLALSVACTALSYYILRRKRSSEPQEEETPPEERRPSRIATPIVLKVGEEVGYTRFFLRQMAMPLEDSMWRRLGKVESVRGYNVLVRWNDGELGTVHCANLAKPGTERWND